MKLDSYDLTKVTSFSYSDNDLQQNACLSHCVFRKKVYFKGAVTDQNEATNS